MSRPFRPSRRGFLAGTVAALVAGLRARPARAAEGRNLIVYWVKGGWDPTFVFDPHFGVSTIEGDLTSSAAIEGGIDFADASSRPSVRAFFTAWGARTAVFNGVAVGSISHDAGTRLLLTGDRGYGGEDLPTRLAAATGYDLPIPHAVVGGPSYPGADGGLVCQLSDKLLRAARGDLASGRDDAREARIQAWLAEEAVGDDPQLAAALASVQRAPALESLAAEVDWPVSQEDGRVRLLARLFSQGLSRTGILTGETPQMTSWDSHIQNQLWQDACYERLFRNLGTLCTTLADSSSPDGGTLLDRTRILVLSEMGRQPKLNAQGGKDHWPTTSAMLIGADVVGGRVYGGTDDGLVARGLDRSTGEASDAAPLFDPAALAATLAVGWDLDPAALGGDGEPFSGVWG